MHIRKFSCERFAGLKDKNVEFQNGLNVVLGPNEAGKSTLVEGVFSALFQSAKLHKTKDKDFIKRCMPYSQGDFIDGKLEIEVDGKCFVIEKEWGENYKVTLRTLEGELVRNESAIKEYLDKILVYGAKTYEGIVFAKQREIRDTLRNIIENQEAVSTIGTILRRTVMEMDKVPVDKLGTKIEADIDSLLKKWDYYNNRPENGREISNPYKNGCGKVIEAYYKKEEKRLEIQRAQEAERNFEEACDNLRKKDSELKELRDEIKELGRIEGDITKRARIEPEILRLQEQMEAIGEVNNDWPVKEYLKTKGEGDLKTMVEKEKELIVEKGLAAKLKEREAIEDRIRKIDGVTKEIGNLNDELKAIPVVTEEDIKKLDAINNRMLAIDAAMKAGKILGKLNSSADVEVWITKGLGEKERLEPVSEFTADSFIKIETSNRLELELKSSEVDFARLREEYSSCKTEFEGLLKKLRVNDKEEAKLNKKKIENLESSIDRQENLIKGILGSDKLEELQEKLKQFESSRAARNLDEVEKELEGLRGRINTACIELGLVKSTIEGWITKYESKSKLLVRLVELQGTIDNYKSELDDLAPLPERFLNTEEFAGHLSELRDRADSCNTEYLRLKDKYYEADRKLPETSYEELYQQFRENEREFEDFRNRLDKLLKVKSAFHSVKEEMDKDSFKPLVDSFSKYLELVTEGKYKIDGLDDSFSLELKTKDSSVMPLDLLSAGTHDSVALALRFSLLEYLVAEKNGFVILDDCLVDLDPGRKQKAIEVIQEFARNNQVIFTTCSPDTAGLLGGNVISM